MALVEIPDELFMRLQASASADYRTVELQLAYFLDSREGRRNANYPSWSNDAAAARQRESRAKRRMSQPVTSVTNVTTCDSRVSPLDGSSSVFPDPSNSNSLNPSSHESSFARMHEPAHEELPFSEEPPGSPALEELASLEETVLSPPSSAAPPRGRRPQPAPKPSRSAYTASFEAFWHLRKWGGSKQEAFIEWKAAGLERDDTLLAVVMAAVPAQVEAKRVAAGCGAFVAPFQDACRWLKNSRWEDNTEPDQEVAVVVRASRRDTVRAGPQNVTDEAILGFLAMDLGGQG